MKITGSTTAGFGLALSLALAALATSQPARSQALTGAAAQPEYQYSTPEPPGVASPDKVETSLGTLRFFDGFPDKATADKLWDNLDLNRAVQAFLLGMPAVSQAANALPSALWDRQTQ